MSVSGSVVSGSVVSDWKEQFCFFPLFKKRGNYNKMSVNLEKIGKEGGIIVRGDRQILSIEKLQEEANSVTYGLSKNHGLKSARQIKIRDRLRKKLAHALWLENPTT